CGPAWPSCRARSQCPGQRACAAVGTQGPVLSYAASWSLFARIPDFQQVGELVHQPAHLRRVRPDHGVVEPTEAEPAQDDPMGPWRANGTTDQGDRDRVVGCGLSPHRYPACGTTALRIRRTSSGSRNWFSPARVACTTLKGLPRPSVFATILWIPANSITALTAPPATIPVPADAGLSSTCSAPNWPWTSWGMVPFLIVTRTRFFLACCTALEMASGTSAALPLPTPTRPCSSPTTTSAVKLNRLPPLTTLATRLM